MAPLRLKEFGDKAPVWGAGEEGINAMWPCPHVGASQATNRESIQKSISRLDEDLSTLGQVSKLSETLSFPHQVRGRHHGGGVPLGTRWDVPWEGWWPWSKDLDWSKDLGRAVDCGQWTF